ARQAQLELLATSGPQRIADTMSAFTAKKVNKESATNQPWLPHLSMPARHEVRSSDIIMRRLQGNIAAAIEAGPSDFADLLMVPGIGARTIRALAIVAEIIHGTPCRFADPARFSFAHGGKDRHPFRH